jgi:hypothetical protein
MNSDSSDGNPNSDTVTNDDIYLENTLKEV